jgi:hypothetical protein
MKTKTFDCVEMKLHGALRIHEETKDITPEEKAAYWKRRNEEMFDHQRHLEEQQMWNDVLTGMLP